MLSTCMVRCSGKVEVAHYSLLLHSIEILMIFRVEKVAHIKLTIIDGRDD